MRANRIASLPPVVAMISSALERDAEPPVVLPQRGEALRRARRGRVGEDARRLRELRAHGGRRLEVGLADVEVVDLHPAALRLVGERHQLADGGGGHLPAALGDLEGHVAAPLQLARRRLVTVSSRSAVTTASRAHDARLAPHARSTRRRGRATGPGPRAGAASPAPASGARPRRRRATGRGSSPGAGRRCAGGCARRTARRAARPAAAPRTPSGPRTAAGAGCSPPSCRSPRCRRPTGSPPSWRRR